MPEGLPLKQLTIIRLITMTVGTLLSVVILASTGFFAPGNVPTLSHALVGMVGVLCLANLIRHLLVLRRLRKE